MAGKVAVVCAEERHVARLTEVNLKRQGYEVHVCAGAALPALMSSKTQIDLFVLDQGLRSPSAEELKSAIRAHPKHSRAEVLIVRRGPGPKDPPDLFCGLGKLRSLFDPGHKL